MQICEFFNKSCCFNFWRCQWSNLLLLQYNDSFVNWKIKLHKDWFYSHFLTLPHLLHSCCVSLFVNWLLYLSIGLFFSRGFETFRVFHLVNPLMHISCKFLQFSRIKRLKSMEAFCVEPCCWLDVRVVFIWKIKLGLTNLELTVRALLTFEIV